jgi:hypothetical protein
MIGAGEKIKRREKQNKKLAKFLVVWAGHKEMIRTEWVILET